MHVTPEPIFFLTKETSFEIIHDLVGEINLVQIANGTPYLKDNDFGVESVTVEDSSGAVFTFPCNDWLSPNKGDGRESRTLLRGMNSRSDCCMDF